MSQRAEDYVRSIAPSLPASQQVILTALARLASVEHTVQISKAQLARRTGLSVPSIKTALRLLCTKGILRKVPQGSAAQGFQANLYSFVELEPPALRMVTPTLKPRQYTRPARTPRTTREDQQYQHMLYQQLQIELQRQIGR